MRTKEGTVAPDPAAKGRNKRLTAINIVDLLRSESDIVLIQD